jgi:glycine dehydrogenase subunit 2
VRLSQKNYGIDTGMFPLGSCTMKHNPRLNEKMARLPGVGDIHPLQPLSTVPGAVELIAELSRWLVEMTGMAAVALTPKAGAHGEMCGMMAIKAAHAARGEKRSVVLVPDSAHGTNPATAALLGYRIESIAVRADGTVDPAEVKKHLSPDVAAIMLTNPNTCGLFERDVVAIADAMHEAGAYFYADGANFNAIVGKVRPGDLGVDAMHINLHKTFSTPHGGGGPGAGPVVLSERLAPFAPLPFITKDGKYVEHADGAGGAKPFGRMCAFHGQMGMYIRAMSYMLSHGSDGMKQASEDAVLNANYVRAALADLMSLPYGNKPCMHEVLFDDAWLDGTGVTTLDFAKAMIDEGFHPMTVYFPLVVHGAMLIEPTESESKASLDLFIGAMRDLALAAKRGDTARFTGAPYHAPRRRLDETRAARQPVLRWMPPKPQQDAAE